MKTPKLTPSQQAAYDRILKDGVLYAYNGVGLRTVNRLENLGLVTTVRQVHTWTNDQSHRTHHRLDWSARPAV